MRRRESRNEKELQTHASYHIDQLEEIRIVFLRQERDIDLRSQMEPVPFQITSLL
jgi:hypothetical protein